MRPNKLWIFAGRKEYKTDNYMGFTNSGAAYGLLLLICLFQINIGLALQKETVRTRYPNGKINTVTILKEGRIVSEVYYFDNGTIKHSWNIDKKIVHSYNSFGYDANPSEVYFKQHCPTYTIYQHYGATPTLLHIERYKDGIRHGWAQYFYTNGQPEAEGEFNQWQKVGFWSYWTPEGRKDIQWHGIKHGFNEKGLSIFHTVLPFCLILLLLISFGIYFIKRQAYPTFSKLVVRTPYILFAGWGLMLLCLDESSALAVKIGYVSDFITILNITTIAMIIICLVNSIWANRLRVKRLLYIGLFVIGSVFGVFTLLMQAIGSIAGAVM